MRLFAISDLHISHAQNREALDTMAHYPGDWLIVAGDIGEKPDHLRYTLDRLTTRFARIFWTPGNHDLWCPSGATDRTRGQARYDELVGICREYGTLTPEDPFVALPPSEHFATSPSRDSTSSPPPHLPSSSSPHVPISPSPQTSPSPDVATSPSPHLPIYLCPLFCLYDYTFHPPGITDPLAWARESGIVCGDEWMLSPEPWPSRTGWCHARVEHTRARLDALPADAQTILVSHWPLRRDLARPPRVPRFSIWCGTTLTEDWPTRYRARIVISGHLHMRTSLMRDGVRHDEVSLGYPRDWHRDRGIDAYLREITFDDRPFVPTRDPFMIPYS